MTAVATVFEGIEESVKVIGSSIGQNSEKIIEHKYGPQAASVASDTFETIGNVYTISKNGHILKPKGIIKSTVKNAGKGIILGGAVATSSQENLNQIIPEVVEQRAVEEDKTGEQSQEEGSSVQPKEGSSKQ